MEKIVFLDRSAIRVELRKPRFAHEWAEYPMTSPGQVLQRLQGATIAITNRVFLNEPDLSRLPELRFIAVAATGVDCIDLEACRRHGITVANVRNWSISVPEHIFAMLLALRRNLLGYNTAVQNGEWSRSRNYTLLLEPMPFALRGSTLGIIGYGELGEKVAEIATAFGMKVLIAERKNALSLRRGRTGFEEVLRRSDALVILCPLTAETSGLIGAAELGKMPKHALLINCARGGIVKDADLAEAVKKGSIAGAGVDVLSCEPPAGGNPLLALHQANLLITPHVAWASRQSLQALGEQLIANLEAFVAGKARNVVT